MSAVIPWPMAAGVLGMARTIGVDFPKTSAKAEMVVPAATEINKVVAEPNRCNRGRASPIICGLTATKTAAGSSGSISLTLTPMDKSQSLGFGSKIHTDFGSIPCSSQPLSNADPIFPQPSSTKPRFKILFENICKSVFTFRRRSYAWP